MVAKRTCFFLQALFVNAFVKALEHLVTEVRLRAYSIRTEQTYETWGVRFLAFQPHDSLEAISGKDVRAFLEHLVLEGGLQEPSHLCIHSPRGLDSYGCGGA